MKRVKDEGGGPRSKRVATDSRKKTSQTNLIAKLAGQPVNSLKCTFLKHSVAEL